MVDCTHREWDGPLRRGPGPLITRTSATSPTSGRTRGWLYLATTIDLASRRVVGFAMADHMRASLVCEALAMALELRHPAAGPVVCRSMGDGDATSHGPFVGATFDAAVSAAKTWLRGQPCKPARCRPFWTSGNALACERLLSGEDGPPGHEIIRLEAA